MYYFLIYKTTNTINGKFYIGTHKTKNINDSYMGSGTLLKRAIKKYGAENFTKEILFIFDNSKDMYEKESEIVNSDFLMEENTYNLNKGGYGGFDYINDNNLSTGTGFKIINENKLNNKVNQHKIASLKIKSDEKYAKYFSQRISNGIKNSDYYKNNNAPFKGKKHTNEFKIKISNIMKDRQSGSKNSQYGTCWITNGKENKKIKKEFIDTWKKLGYYRGRII